MSNIPDKPVKDDPPFLGGGLNFNQAGLNTPLPGEKTADAKPPLPFGGPRVWLGTIVVILLIAFIWMFYAQGPAGLHDSSGHGGGISPNDQPSDNPDTPSSQ